VSAIALVARDVREAKRGIAAGIAWAEEGCVMADVELVLKHLVCIRTRRRRSIIGLTKF
jgi:hypothetical protein